MNVTAEPIPVDRGKVHKIAKNMKKAHHCAPHEFQCANWNECVPMEVRCDSYHDCFDRFVQLQMGQTFSILEKDIKFICKF